MEDKILLKVDHLKTFFKTKSGILPAVNGVSFTLKRGEVLGVVGESGCGKSVMSMSILKLIEKYGGKVQEGSSVELEGRQVLDLPEKAMCDLRGKEISMISQDPMTSLNPVFTVEKQMVEMICRHTDMDKKRASAHALSWLKRVGIPEAEKRMKEYILSSTRITEEVYDRNYRRDWFMFSEEMIQLGIADEIVTDIDTIL